MFDNALSSIAAQLIRDLQNPDTIWQALILLLVFAIAKFCERSVRGNDKLMEGRGRAARLGHGGLKRLIFPLAAVLLTALARESLRAVMHVNLFSLAIPLLFSLAVIRFVFFVLRVTFNQSPWMRNFELAFSTVVWGVVALHILGLLPAVVDLLEAVSFSAGKQRLNLWMILQGGLLVAATLLLSLWFGNVIDNRLVHASGLDNNLQVAFSRLAKAVLILLAVMIALPAVGIDLTALSVFGGALGVGLGFGLQKIASNYVSGFIILLERSIRIGNIITVGADKGKVAKITTRYTVLRAGNGVESLIPNELLVSGTVQNETYSDTSVRYVLAVQAGYQDDPEQVIALLERIAKEQAQIAATPEPKAFFTAFADSGINFELLYWLESPDINAQQVRSSLNRAIWKAFGEAGFSFPYPQREVRLLSAPEYDKSSSKSLSDKQ
ncbi:MAG TPA: mechanosensitive ion channel domain-containing protein [Rhodocyclaceae bacterium]|nr:mechanosensitive ion channel domain-containing protein [Rhodocyclaceae bacterium]